MTPPYPLVVATTTRFHLLDLARELLALGHEVRLFSYLPHAQVEKYGFPRARHHSLLLPLAPGVALLRLARSASLRRTVSELLLARTDRLIARRLPACAAVIGLSGLAVATSARARQLGAQAIVDSGSSHVAHALRLLDRRQISHRYERRERLAYAGADRIVVPSTYAARSFLEQGVPAARLFVNPYGVDLDVFRPTSRLPGRPTLLYVGNWSRRKGCDLLVAAWQALAASADLLHVGPVIDAPLPTQPGFHHHPPVPQAELVRFYARGDALVLASRDDGYPLVLHQAAACGLRIVASTHAGGPDLSALLAQPRALRTFPAGDLAALTAALRDTLADLAAAAADETAAPGAAALPASSAAASSAPAAATPRDWLGARRATLGWRAYAERYVRFLSDLLTAA